MPVAVGDRVRLAVAGSSLVRAASYLYGAPLLGLLAAAALAYLPAGDGNDAVGVIWALTGLAAGGLAGAALARRDACFRGMTPTITGPAPRDRELTST